MSTPIASELCAVAAPDTEERLDSLTCEDLCDDWQCLLPREEFHDIANTLVRTIRIHVDHASEIVLCRADGIHETGTIAFRADLRAQIRRAFRKISDRLSDEGLSWSHVVRVYCYVRQAGADGVIFTEELRDLCASKGISCPPSAAVIEAILAPAELLAEVEAIAIAPAENEGQAPVNQIRI